MSHNNTQPSSSFHHPRNQRIIRALNRRNSCTELHSRFHLVATHSTLRVLLYLLLTTLHAYALNLCNREQRWLRTHRRPVYHVYVNPPSLPPSFATVSLSFIIPRLIVSLINRWKLTIRFFVQDFLVSSKF